VGGVRGWWSAAGGGAARGGRTPPLLKKTRCCCCPVGWPAKPNTQRGRGCDRRPLVFELVPHQPTDGVSGRTRFWDEGRDSGMRQRACINNDGLQLYEPSMVRQYSATFTLSAFYHRTPVAGCGNRPLQRSLERARTAECPDLQKRNATIPRRHDHESLPWRGSALSSTSRTALPP